MDQKKMVIYFKKLSNVANTFLGTYLETLYFHRLFLHQNPLLKAVLLAIFNIEGIENQFPNHFP